MKTEEQKAWWFRFFLLLFVLDPQWSWWSHDSESETPPGVPRRNLALCLQPASKVVSEGEGLGGGVREEGGALWLLQSRNVFILGVQTVELFCRKIMLMGFFFEDGEHWRGERWRIQNRKWWWITFTFSCPFSGGALVLFFFYIAELHFFATIKRCVSANQTASLWPSRRRSSSWQTLVCVHYQDYFFSFGVRFDERNKLLFYPAAFVRSFVLWQLTWWFRKPLNWLSDTRAKFADVMEQNKRQNL